MTVADTGQAIKAVADNPGAIAYVVLTLARVTCLLATDSIVPKREAAEWLRGRVGEPAATGTALDACLRVRASNGRVAIAAPEREAVFDLARRLAVEISR